MSARVFVLSALFALAGCYKTPDPDCAFRCGPGNACPSGYLCHDDGQCHLDSASAGACPALNTTPDAAEPEPDAPLSPDASEPDAPMIDAPVSMPDAPPPDAPPAPDAPAPDAPSPDAPGPDA